MIATAALLVGTWMCSDKSNRTFDASGTTTYSMRGDSDRESYRYVAVDARHGKLAISGGNMPDTLVQPVTWIKPSEFQLTPAKWATHPMRCVRISQSATK